MRIEHKINKCALKIDEKESLFGTASLSSEELTVKNIWNALGVLENGSFQYFFECQIIFWVKITHWNFFGNSSTQIYKNIPNKRFTFKNSPPQPFSAKT